MGWNGLERNKLDYILTDLLPVELSELFSFRSFYDFLHGKEQQAALLNLTEKCKKIMAEGKEIIFQNGWSTMPLKYNILKGSDSTREMSVVQPLSALNLYLFIECYQRDILNFFEAKHCFSIRYHKKNTAMYYKSRANKATHYFQLESERTGKAAVQQAGNYFRISPFESINSFPDSRIWRICNFEYKYYATMDYKSCFDSVYTHAYKWIIERNVIDSTEVKNTNLFISIDRILQNINGKSSNGLIVGPEFSRMIAEVLLQEIDSKVLLSLSKNNIVHDRDYAIFRYVDDIFIFTRTQENRDIIIDKYKMIAEKYLLRLNELKLIKGETPFIPKAWLEKTRHLSDVVEKFFNKWKKEEYEKLPDDERFLLKSDFIPIDRIKSEVAVVIKDHPNDKRTIVSFLLSTLLNNISKRKDGYTLFGKNKTSKAMMLIDMAFYLYAFYPSFDQTRKLISIIVYIDNEINFKNDTNSTKILKDVINRYSFIFKRGNIFDLCDWFPFFSEYGISLVVEAENDLIEKANAANDPIIWANMLLYSKYNESFFNDIAKRLHEVLEEQILKITKKNVLLHKEFWYILIFHNCPFVLNTLKGKMDSIISNLIISTTSSSSLKPSSIAIKLMCDYLLRKSPNGNKPAESFFNWNNIRGISAQITYRTFQRTIFKRYSKNKHSLYASIN